MNVHAWAAEGGRATLVVVARAAAEDADDGVALLVAAAVAACQKKMRSSTDAPCGVAWRAGMAVIAVGGGEECAWPGLWWVGASILCCCWACEQVATSSSSSEQPGPEVRRACAAACSDGVKQGELSEEVCLAHPHRPLA